VEFADHLQRVLHGHRLDWDPPMTWRRGKCRDQGRGVRSAHVFSAGTPDFADEGSTSASSSKWKAGGSLAGNDSREASSIKPSNRARIASVRSSSSSDERRLGVGGPELVAPSLLRDAPGLVTVQSLFRRSLHGFECSWCRWARGQAEYRELEAGTRSPTFETWDRICKRSVGFARGLFTPGGRVLDSSR
jgi:hypothetical protein